MSDTAMLSTVGWGKPFAEPCFVNGCAIGAGYRLDDAGFPPLYCCHMHLKEVSDAHTRRKQGVAMSLADLYLDASVPDPAVPEPILVYRFHEAPQSLQALSTNGGDEDWLAILPPVYVDQYISWCEEPNFGCCCVHEYPHPTKPGYRVRIGSHA